MAPITELHAAQDDAAAWGVKNAGRFAPIPCPLPDERKPVRVLPPTVAARTPNLIDCFASLSNAALRAEASALQARMLGVDYSTRDFAIVTALIQRLA